MQAFLQAWDKSQACRLSGRLGVNPKRADFPAVSALKKLWIYGWRSGHLRGNSLEEKEQKEAPFGEF
jgi:hypothetical protein